MERGPDEFIHDNAFIGFDANNGDVYFVNANGQLLALTDEGKLEMYYFFPECGNKGFKEDFESFIDYEGCELCGKKS